MDEQSLRLLQFDKVRERAARFARSALARDRVLTLQPTHDVAAVKEAVGRTAEMVEALAARLEPPVGGLFDVAMPLKRAKLGVLIELEPMRQIRDLIDLAGRTYDYWLRLGTDYPRLEKFLSDLEDQRHIARAIDAAIDEKGRVRDHATPELATVRAELAAHEEKIQIELRRLLRSAEVRKALRFTQATLSGEHHVLPVAVNYRHVVPGVVHRVSSTGETIYIEPAKVAEITAEMALLRSAEAREVRRVLRRLTDLVARDVDRLLQSLEILTELDTIRTKADYAIAFDMTAPDVSDRGPLRLREARHPILLDLFRERATAAPAVTEDVTHSESTIASPDGKQAPNQVVPISVTLGDTFDILVVTGPNTGGKTVAIKTIGLFAAMAQSGFLIPANVGSRLPVFRDVLVDIGDEQSLEQSLSTFSAHISRIGSILERAGGDTLVLLDELGAGTDPTEGAALGRAILDELIDRRALAIVTTHLGDLKTYALTAERAENGAVEFDPVTLRPTYRLLVGQFGQSCALKIARRLKFPRHVLERAKKKLRKKGRKAKELADLQGLREEAIKARESATRAEEEARQAAEGLAKKTEQLQQEQKVSAEIERLRETLRPGDQVRVPRFDKLGTVVRVDSRRRQIAVSVGKVEWELRLDEVIPVPKTGG